MKKFYSAIECSYDEEGNCKAYGCDIDDICRCRRIYNLKKIKFNYYDFIESCAYNLNINRKDYVNNYYLSRLTVLLQIYELDDWEVYVDGGYYGDELSQPQLTNEDKLKALIIEIDYMLSLSNADKLQRLLTLEYGYLSENFLSNFKNKIIENKSVNKKDIIFPENRKIADSPVKPLYAQINYINMPIAICYSIGDKYKIIDGHTRIFMAPDEKISILKIS